jgi:hypothetical protein
MATLRRDLGRQRGALDGGVGGAARAFAAVLDRLVVGGADVRDPSFYEIDVIHRALARTVEVHAALRALVHHGLIRELLDGCGARRCRGSRRLRLRLAAEDQEECGEYDDEPAHSELPGRARGIRPGR